MTSSASLARLNELDAWHTAHLLARRELSAVDLARACLDRVAERDGEVHAFAHIDPDAALAQARALDAGELPGPLHGLPLGVKDLFDTADAPTAYGSPIYAGHARWPMPQPWRCVARPAHWCWARR